MKRREFIAMLGGVAAWPFAVLAQQAAKPPTVGFLGGVSGDLFRGPLTAFRDGLGQSGYVDGSSVTIEYRWTAGRNEVLSSLVDDLVAHRVDVIATTTTPGALAAKVATSNIPIVFAIGSDPVRDGLVSSLNRPGSNVTGATALTVELGPKRLELLHELVPSSRKVAILVNPTNAPLADEQLRDLPMAARQLGLELHRLDASTEGQIEGAFADLARVGASALMITADSLFTSHSPKIAALALRDAVPTIYQNRTFAAAGGLLSYGGSTADAWRIAGAYVGRILKGEKPANLPIQQPSKVELFVNLRTAKTLGIDVPPPILARADEVIE